jgi:hypothetical protein
LHLIEVTIRSQESVIGKVKRKEEFQKENWSWIRIEMRTNENSVMCKKKGLPLPLIMVIVGILVKLMAVTLLTK